MDEWLLHAWSHLNAARGYLGGGMGPPAPRLLTWAATDHYADRLGCGPDNRATLHQVISALDRHWLTQERERMRIEAAAESARRGA